MKRFTQKFFLLAIGMILSVGASAQSTVKHRYPEVTYKLSGNTYKLPAWDVMMGDLPFRLQAIDGIEGIPDDINTHIRGKIVGRRAFTTHIVNNNVANGDYLFTAMQNESSSYDITITNFNGVEEQLKRDAWTYGQVFGVKGQVNAQGVEGWMAPEDADMKIFAGDTFTTTDLAIPSTHLTGGTSAFAGFTFDIVAIGVAAFRNYNSSNFNIISSSGTLTIPSSVEVIEHDAFRNSKFKKVILDKEVDGSSHLTTICRAAFAGSGKLEEINIPASVETIEGLAFGGCASLNKITFEGSTVPTFTKEIQEPNYNNGGPYDIFQNIKRFTDTGASTPNVTPSKCIIEVPLGTAKSYLDNNTDPDKHLDLARFPMKSKFPMTISVNEEDLDLNIISYCSDVPFTFKQYDTATGWNTGDVKAYYIEKSGVDVVNGKVTLTEIKEDKKIPSNPFGVVLSGTGGQTYEIFYPNNLLDELSVANNCFTGVITKTLIEIEEGVLYYVLSNGKFIPVKKSGNLSANRAYLKYEPGEDDDITVPIVGSKELSVSLPEDTGISNHEEERGVQNDAWYTLQGIQVNQPQKGIFIKNGKKFVIK